MILGSLNLSTLVLANPSDKIVLQINYFHFQRHTKDNLRSNKLLYKKYLIVRVLIIHGYGDYWNHVQTYFMYNLYFST